jgi:hypothetical protein
LTSFQTINAGFESGAMGVSERTLCDHVEVQPNSIEDQSTGAELFPTSNEILFN